MSGLWVIITVGLLGTALTVGAALMLARARLRQQSQLWSLLSLGVGILMAVGSWAGAAVVIHHTVTVVRTANEVAPQAVPERQHPEHSAEHDDQLATGRDVQFGRDLSFAHQLHVRVGAPITKDNDGTKVECVAVTLINGGTQTAKVDLADFQMFNNGTTMPQMTSLSSDQRVPASHACTVKLLFQVPQSHDDGQLVVSYHGAGWEWQGTSF